ncbi:MAG TPA: hypothetical protein VKI19_03375 [Acidimicrobiales bacterium]|nr:hypothetical protein [Acidimicrobiales bacterium]
MTEEDAGMFDPVHFIPERRRVAGVTACASPYELAWRESHCGKTLSEAIESVRAQLEVTYDLASSLVWAEVEADAPRLPAR